ncbi:MAG: dihydropteroate synthase [Alphaproteobacteria bacterium]|nr:dihydropteroate synthase [Alphaproteobacteria bacterium]
MAPILLGILNITEDSFSDGNKYLAPQAAIAHGRALAEHAQVLDIGAASSNPDSKAVPPEVEIARMVPVVAALEGVAISVDSFAPAVQRWAMAQGVAYINDIQGFPFPDLYPELAASSAKLVVMHSVQGLGPATRVRVEPDELYPRIVEFFGDRIAALTAAGVARERIVLDPGMGLFLGNHREASFAVLRRIADLKREFALPVLVSVSRKSFLRRLVGREVAEIAPATLAAELFAARAGADYIRTHDPRALKDALLVTETLETGRNRA